MSSDVSMESTTTTPAMTELERNALARAERLKQLRAKTTSNANETESSENGDTKEGFLIFRSYQPINSIDNSVFERQSNEEKFSVVDRKIGDMVKDTHEVTTINEDLDINILAPKKVDWDLKRGLQSKLDTLNKRKEKAISQLITIRLQEGDNKLMPAAINAALKAQTKDNEDDDED